MGFDPLEPATGMLIIAVAHVPFLREVYLQLRLSSQLYGLVTPARRSQFPDAPAQPTWLVLASARFHLAFWSYVKREEREDTPLQAGLKRALLRSMKRKVVVAVLGFLVAGALLAAGWRPYPP